MSVWLQCLNVNQHTDAIYTQAEFQASSAYSQSITVDGHMATAQSITVDGHMAIAHRALCVGRGHVIGLSCAAVLGVERARATSDRHRPMVRVRVCVVSLLCRNILQDSHILIYLQTTTYMATVQLSR